MVHQVYFCSTGKESCCYKRSQRWRSRSHHVGLTHVVVTHYIRSSEELDETDNIGVRRAVGRKLKHQLGIPPEQVQKYTTHAVELSDQNDLKTCSKAIVNFKFLLIVTQQIFYSKFQFFHDVSWYPAKLWSWPHIILSLVIVSCFGVDFLKEELFKS